jgi:putative transposase
MSRVGRVVIAGVPHHVTQRGNRRADVFVSDSDRQAYLGFVKKYAECHGLMIWAYCLMTNHVHLIAVPAREESLSLALRDAHTVYAMRFNTRTQSTGHVWQGRFYSCPLDDEHLWAAVRYVERNPVRAGLIGRAEEYQWSSARAHCGITRDALLSGDFPPADAVENWGEWLLQEDDAAITDSIRHHTNTGRPCGSPDFVDRLEGLLGRTLRPARRGRKLGSVQKRCSHTY